jgi:hypothetical protein
MGGKKCISVSKPEGKTQFGRPGRRREEIKLHLNETGWAGVDWTLVASDKDHWRESSREHDNEP